MPSCMRRLHIGLITPAYPPSIGGISSYVHQLATSIADYQHEVTVIATDAPTSQMRENDSIEQSGVRVIRIGPTSAGFGRFLTIVTGLSQVGQSFAVHQALCQWHRDYPFDILEFANWRALGALPSFNKIAPHVTRVTTGIKQVTQPENLGSQTSRCTAQERREKRGVRRLHALERWAVRHSDIIISPTLGHWRSIASTYNLQPRDKKVVIVPFSVELPVQIMTRQSKLGRPCRLLYVGRLTHRKGFDVFAEALSIIFARARIDIEVIVIGQDSSSSEYDSAWTHYTTQLSLNARTRLNYLGPVGEAAKNQAYRDADVFIAPSRYESFGLTYIEAMSFGLPVVGCYVGGVPEIITDQVTGLLVSPGNVAELAEATLCLIHNPQLRWRIGEAARHEVAERFSPQSFVEATLAAYNLALSRRE